MNMPFWKMHGAGNDFVLIDDRAEMFPSSDKDWLARMSARRTGVGCEGIILIQRSDKADFRMRFFNPDGTEAEMCGNGARCVARLAADIGVAPPKMAIDTQAGILKAEIVHDMVRLRMTPPKDWRLDRSLQMNGASLTYSFVNTGVPHAVVTVASAKTLRRTNVVAIGRKIRHHNDFAPAGTNADFIAPTGPNSLSLRTYERGVEDETLACGTGIVAGALIAARLGSVAPPVNVTAASGDALTVDFKLTDKGAKDVTLLGPAVYVFHGNLAYPAEL